MAVVQPALTYQFNIRSDLHQSRLLRTRVGSVAKIVKLEHAWRRLDPGRNDDGFPSGAISGVMAILWAVRWYCRYPISYRDLEEMLAERGISVDHTTIYRWVQCYAPEMGLAALVLAAWL